jgi:hypothetical protein
VVIERRDAKPAPCTGDMEAWRLLEATARRRRDERKGEQREVDSRTESVLACFACGMTVSTTEDMARLTLQGEGAMMGQPGRPGNSPCADGSL